MIKIVKTGEDNNTPGHSNENGIINCPYESDKMDQLISCIKFEVGKKIDILASEMRMLNTYHKNIIKWLLFVVCLIALGRSLIELGEQILSHHVVIQKDIKDANEEKK